MALYGHGAIIGKVSLDDTTINKYTPVQVWDIEDVMAIAAGGTHSMALKKDGTVWAWGYNESGQLGVGGMENSLLPVKYVEGHELIDSLWTYTDNSIMGRNIKDVEFGPDGRTVTIILDGDIGGTDSIEPTPSLTDLAGNPVEFAEYMEPLIGAEILGFKVAGIDAVIDREQKVIRVDMPPGTQPGIMDITYEITEGTELRKGETVNPREMEFEDADSDGIWDTVVIELFASGILLERYELEIKSAPSVPVGLAAEVLDSTCVELRWDDALHVRWNIYVSTDGINYEKEGETSSTIYIVENLSPNTRYTFRITAQNEAGESPYSETVEVKMESGKGKGRMDLLEWYIARVGNELSGRTVEEQRVKNAKSLALKIKEHINRHGVSEHDMVREVGRTQVVFNILDNAVNRTYPPEVRELLVESALALIDGMERIADKIENEQSKANVVKRIVDVMGITGQLSGKAAEISAEAARRAAEKVLETVNKISETAGKMESAETVSEIAKKVVTGAAWAVKEMEEDELKAEKAAQKIGSVAQQAVEKTGQVTARADIQEEEAIFKIDEEELKLKMEKLVETVEEMNKALEEEGITAKTVPEMTVKVQEDVDSMEMEIRAKIVENMKSKGIRSFTVDTGIAKTTVNLEDETIGKNEGGIKIKMKRVGQEKTAVSIGVELGEDELTGDIPMTMEILYMPEEGEDVEKITVFRLDEYGGEVNEYGIYDSGTVKFNTNVPGTFEVSEAEVSFTDVEDTRARREMEVMAAKGVIRGTEEGEFLLRKELTRAEFVAYIVRQAGLEVKRIHEVEMKDVPKNRWYYDEMAAAVEAGIIKGHEDGSLYPEEKITRQEMITMASRAMIELKGAHPALNVGNYLRFKDAGQLKEYAKEHVATMVKYGILELGEDEELEPASFVVREEAAVMIYRMHAWQITGSKR